MGGDHEVWKSVVHDILSNQVCTCSHKTPLQLATTTACMHEHVNYRSLGDTKQIKCNTSAVAVQALVDMGREE
jgi:hypothetical protein